METLIQLGIVIGIIALAFFLIEKVAKIFLKVLIIVVALFFIISAVTLFSTYNQLKEADTELPVYVGLQESDEAVALFFNEGEDFETFGEEDARKFIESPEEFGNKKDRKVIISGKALYLFNKSKETLVDEITQEPSFEERSIMLKQAYSSFIEETSFIKMSYLYFSRNLKIIPERRLLRAWLIEKPMSWVSAKISGVK
ncbi:MAG TPA: hypothetical protein ENN46_02720 [Candidatus Woesearchaeota archaeon]|nr:hypothetical protein [Candidatus Woesearchaeota archaeon]